MGGEPWWKTDAVLSQHAGAKVARPQVSGRNGSPRTLSRTFSRMEVRLCSAAFSVCRLDTLPVSSSICLCSSSSLVCTDTGRWRQFRGRSVSQAGRRSVCGVKHAGSGQRVRSGDGSPVVSRTPTTSPMYLLPRDVSSALAYTVKQDNSPYARPAHTNAPSGAHGSAAAPCGSSPAAPRAAAPRRRRRRRPRASSWWSSAPPPHR